MKPGPTLVSRKELGARRRSPGLVVSTSAVLIFALMVMLYLLPAHAEGCDKCEEGCVDGFYAKERVSIRRMKAPLSKEIDEKEIERMMEKASDWEKVDKEEIELPLCIHGRKGTKFIVFESGSEGEHRERWYIMKSREVKTNRTNVGPIGCAKIRDNQTGAVRGSGEDSCN